MGKKAERAIRIDAVALTRRIRDVQHEELGGLSWEDRVAYYRAKAEALHGEIKRSRKPKRTAA